MGRKHIKWASSSIAGIALILSTAGACGTSPQLNDLRNVKQIYPDYAVTLLNVDNFPNVTIMCFQGEAFVTTTRPDMSAMRIDPGLESFCKTKIGQHTK